MVKIQKKGLKNKEKSRLKRGGKGHRKTRTNQKVIHNKKQGEKPGSEKEE